MPKDNFIPEISVLFPETGDESYLLVGCRKADYSASLISRAVEDCNASVLNLNVTSLQADADSVVVSVRVNHRNPEAVVRSLERYGYEVLTAVAGSEDDNHHMRRRADELLRYLEI